MRVLLIGEHDKGLGEPFSEKTVSGRRLRSIIRCYGISATIVNMMKCTDKAPKQSDIRRITRHVNDHQSIIFLGRKVERELQSYFPEGHYLPHPASRRTVDQITLERGLAQYAEITTTN